MEEEKIALSGETLTLGKSKIALASIESIYIGEQNPARDRAYVFIAIGAVLIIFTSRWFMAGGFLSVLAGIVSFFDSRRKYSLLIKTKEKEIVAFVSYDLRKVKKTKAYLEEKTKV
ncbi:MAG: hypothetical protein A6F72_04310 [Cycloclasticus sp. symbiont of Poecilosclerida sp. N]|nr:MAG: hypothetical protein A6F72_04310 [Cycloclasticus sp. symbiont of Poecilosclerida sp. N]